jgi:hypothetical protein
VTGHRALDDIDSVTGAVDAVLDRLAGGDGGATLEIRSGLAEGADRLVAERVLARAGARLVAVLPLGRDDYASDFETAASRAAFDDLLARAAEVVVVDPAPTREAAYERAGQAVVDTSDVLLALWDGEESRGQGGTAEIVRYARERGVAVEVVPVVRAIAERAP